jgi:hypothetical protein
MAASPLRKRKRGSYTRLALKDFLGDLRVKGSDLGLALASKPSLSYYTYSVLLRSLDVGQLVINRYSSLLSGCFFYVYEGRKKGEGGK